MQRKTCYLFVYAAAPGQLSTRDDMQRPALENELSFSQQMSPRVMEGSARIAAPAEEPVQQDVSESHPYSSRGSASAATSAAAPADFGIGADELSEQSTSRRSGSRPPTGGSTAGSGKRSRRPSRYREETPSAASLFGDDPFAGESAAAMVAAHGALAAAVSIKSPHGRSYSGREGGRDGGEGVGSGGGDAGGDADAAAAASGLRGSRPSSGSSSRRLRSTTSGAASGTASGTASGRTSADRTVAISEESVGAVGFAAGSSSPPDAAAGAGASAGAEIARESPSLSHKHHQNLVAAPIAELDRNHPDLGRTPREIMAERRQKKEELDEGERGSTDAAGQEEHKSGRVDSSGGGSRGGSRTGSRSGWDTSAGARSATIEQLSLKGQQQASTLEHSTKDRQQQQRQEDDRLEHNAHDGNDFDEGLDADEDDDEETAGGMSHYLSDIESDAASASPSPKRPGHSTTTVTVPRSVLKPVSDTD